MCDKHKVAKEFFQLPEEEGASFFSEDPKQKCQLYTSIDDNKEKVHFWKTNLLYPCHPLENHTQELQTSHPLEFLFFKF